MGITIHTFVQSFLEEIYSVALSCTDEKTQKYLCKEL